MKLKISFILNVLIVLMVLFASIVMFANIKFMSGSEIVLESTGIGMFRFFTVDSNFFMGIVALLYSIEEIKILKDKTYKISRKLNIFKYMATVSVSLTCFVVFVYLGRIVNGGIVVLLQNSNLFFHLIIPVTAFLTFVLFERNNDLKYKNTFYCLIPALVYGVFYLINVLIHMENGSVLPKYDWYYFVQNGVWTSLIVLPAILFITYILGLIIWALNHKK